MICANPDLVVRVANRLVICASSIARRYSELGGPVIFAGKPEAPIYDEALKRMQNALRATRYPNGDCQPWAIHVDKIGNLDMNAFATTASSGNENRWPRLDLVGFCDWLRWV